MYFVDKECGVQEYKEYVLLHLNFLYPKVDRLSGLVVRVPGFGYRDPGLDSRRYNILWMAVGVAPGPLSLVKINEGLLERELAAPV
jgi:hypothetical protein